MIDISMCAWNKCKCQYVKHVKSPMAILRGLWTNCYTLTFSLWLFAQYNGQFLTTNTNKVIEYCKMERIVMATLSGNSYGTPWFSSNTQAIHNDQCIVKHLVTYKKMVRNNHKNDVGYVLYTLNEVSNIPQLQSTLEMVPSPPPTPDPNTH
jgi:hypothetical protein